MRKVLFFLWTSVVIHSVYSQTYTWAATDTTYSSSRGGSLTMDKSENLITAELNSSGISIVKYNNYHQFIWRKDFQVYMMTLPQICVDKTDNIYISGGAAGNMVIDTTAYPAGGMFLIKLDKQGTFQWYKRGAGQVNSKAVTTDENNNVYVGGSLSGAATFDNSNVNSPVCYSYVVKYNPNGNLQWLKYASTNHSSLSYMATDKIGNTYITGEFTGGVVNFGNIPLTPYGTNAYEDVYLAKLDSSGNWIWVRHAGGDDQDNGAGLTLDKKGNIYITGFIGSTTSTFGNVTLTNTGGDDFFIAKYDTAGNVLWAINGGGAGSQIGNDICVGSNGTIYLGTNSKFISVFDTLGNYTTWYQKSVSNDAMIADDSCGVYISGYFQDSVTFGNYTLTSKNSSQRMYVAKLYAQALTSSIASHTFSESFLIYPNPSNHLVTLKFTSTSQTPIILNIKNSLGQSVYNETLKEFFGSFIKQIDLIFLSKGIYFIELVQENKSSTQKIILH